MNLFYNKSNRSLQKLLLLELVDTEGFSQEDKKQAVFHSPMSKCHGTWPWRYWSHKLIEHYCVVFLEKPALCTLSTRPICRYIPLSFSRSINCSEKSQALTLVIKIDPESNSETNLEPGSVRVPWHGNQLAILRQHDLHNATNNTQSRFSGRIA